MKAGNVSNASDISLIMAGMNSQNFCAQAGSMDSFNTVMDRKTVAGSIPDFGTTRDYKPEKKDFVRSDSNDVRRIVTADRSRVTSGKNNRPDSRQAAEAADEIISTVSAGLGITDEELISKLNELGLTLSDITKPQNMAVLIADINNTDVTAIVTDQKLGSELTELVGKVTGIIENLAEQSGVEPEELVGMLTAVELKPVEQENAGKEDRSMPDDNEMPDQSSGDGESQDVTTTVIRDEATGKEIKVTVENSTGQTVDARAVGDIKESDAGQAQTGDESRQGQKEQHSMQAAQNIVDNLTQAVTESVSDTTSGSGSNVNGTDVFNQILEAVRVNVSQNTTSMEIQLMPEHFGKISLTVSASKDGILTASIVTQNEAVRAAVENQIVQLKEALNNQGLKIQEVQVTVASHGFNMNDGMQDRNGDDRRQKSSSRHFNSEAGIDLPADNADSDTEQAMMKINGSSVSYTA